jgi:uncharacterized lipoprotein YmbA
MKARVQLDPRQPVLALGLAGCLGSAPSTRLYQLESVADKSATRTRRAEHAHACWSAKFGFQIISIGPRS